MKVPALMHWWEALDTLGFSLVNRLAFPGLFPLMVLLTTLGAAPLVIAQGAVVTAALVWAGRRVMALGLWGAVAGAWVLEAGLKAFFGRPRPVLPQMVYAGGFSFPSGHSLVAFVLYGYIALLLWTLPLSVPARRSVGSSRTRGWVALFLLLPLAIGVSRVYLGVHYPTDVVAGWLLGGGWLAVWWSWWQRPSVRSYWQGKLGKGRVPARMSLGLLGVVLLTTVGWPGPSSPVSRCHLSTVPGVSLPADLAFTLRSIYGARARTLLTGDPSVINAYYDARDEAGRWSLEHDATRARYLRTWADKRGVVLEDVSVEVRVGVAEVEEKRAWLEMAVNEKVRYRYRGLGSVNSFGVGAWHVMQLVKRDGRWWLRKDWYSDPLEEPPVVADSRQGEAAASPPKATPSPSAAGRQRYNQEAAVAYADRYCGPAAGLDCHYNNEKYRDYSPLGGDCANYVSQVLTDPQAGGLPMDDSWFYRDGKGTRAWTRAEDLVFHLLDRGLAELRGRGAFNQVGEKGQAVYGLEAGDVIGYEQGGHIRHVAVIVGADTAGYPLVNSHTGDRYHVPWDLGWDATTVFWLLHICR